MTDSNHNQIISRMQAIENGLDKYCAGKPCKYGHGHERYVSSYGCVECSKIATEKRRATLSDDAKIKILERRSALGKKSRLSRSEAKKASDNEKQRIRHKKMLKNRSEEVRARYRERKRRWVENNREISRRWAKANPEKAKASKINAKAKRKCVVGTHTAKEISDLMIRQNHKCAECKCAISIKKGKDVTVAHLDHIVPISRGGSNYIRNLQYLCIKCNLSKGALDPIEWARRNNRLI